MQIVLLVFLAAVFSAAAAAGTSACLEQRRGRTKTVLIFAAGVILCLMFSVLTECIMRAGRPVFYYHTHKPGLTTLKIFGVSCLSAALFWALFLMLAERRALKKTLPVWIIRSFLFGVCGALILEIVFFNFRHFELIGARAPEVSYPSDRIQPVGFYFNRASWKFHPYTWEPGHRFIVYAGNNKIRNIAVPLDDGTDRSVIRIGFNDRAHRNNIQLPERELVRGIPRSGVVPLHTVGKTYSFTIELPDVSGKRDIPNYGVSLPRITINQKIPLEIDPVRFGFCFLVIFLAAAFFPGSPLWYVPLDFRSFPQMLFTAAFLGFFILWFGWTVFSSYSGSEKSFSEQKAELNENYLQYNKLVDALMVPRYSLPDVPNRYLEQLDDVYDMKQREGKKIDYLWDTAYYNGRYYVYFGVVPAVTVLLPWRMLTGEYLELDYPILAFSILFLLGLYGVYAKIVKNWFRNISFGLYIAGLLLLVTPLNLTWCLRRTLVYELAITSGICFAVWGIFFILPEKPDGRLRPFSFFLSGACAGLAVGCRPTMVFASLVVFTAGICRLKQTGKIFARRNILSLVLFLIPYAAAGLALMKYNYERFLDPLEFGITYQLTTENRAAGLPLLGPYGRILIILSDLLTFPAIDMNFPFIHMQQPVLAYNGMILDSDRILGVFAYPVMAFLLLYPLFRNRLDLHGRGLRPFLLSCLLAAAGICVVSSGFAAANRYLTDYLYLAALPAVVLFFIFSEYCGEKSWPELAQGAALICGITAFFLFIAVSLTGEDDWFRRINPFYFEQLKYALSPWL